jgi:hypothetical protein
MKVRRLDGDGDWTFGNGKANYLKDNNAVLQNVATRIKSFKNDWFLDGEAHIDWFTILGSKENKQTIINEIERVALSTEGVMKINLIELSKSDNRSAKISIVLDTIYSINNSLGLEI